MSSRNIAQLRTQRSPLPFDPAMPAIDRHALLIGALPQPLQDLLAAGQLKRRPRFAEDGFDGMIEKWSPPAGVTAQHAAMAQRVLEDLAMTALAPAPTDHVLARVLALLSHYPAKGMSPDVERLVALDWAEDLAAYPAWAIDAAARTWRRTKKWRPSIAEMRGLCDDLCAGELGLAERLQAIVLAHRKEPVKAEEVRSLIKGIRRM